MADYYENDDELLAEARRCYKLVADTESQQRIRERDDLLFQMPENQWTDAAKAERAGGVQGGVQTPPRPMLSISLLKQPMQLVQNQAAKAKLGVTLHPVSEDANDELAETKQGLYRRIERDGGADVARMWAFDRAKIAGRGYYRVITKYDEDSQDSRFPFDQEIGYQRFLHQENVYFDPAAIEPDFSDAEWCLITNFLTDEQFRREFSDEDLPGAVEWEAFDNVEPGWVQAISDQRKRAYLVAEYWRKHIERETICLLKSGHVVPKGKVPKGAEVVKELTRDVVTVCCYKVCGLKVLEKREDYKGKYIPIVAVTGVELQPVDGERRWIGMVRDARDGQMAYNYAISSAVEDISRLSKAPYVGAEGQFEGHEEKWNTANVRNYPYLEYRPVTLDGKPMPPPQPVQIDGTKLQLSMAMADQAKGMVQAATAVFEPSLGEMPTKREAQSGRAILALQSQSDAGTSQFMISFAISLRYEAKVVLDLMPHIYDRPGRITRVLGGEDESETVMLGRPYVQDDKGFPQPAQPGQQGAKPPIDLAKGRYAISVDIGKDSQTQFEAGQNFMAEVISSAPQLMTVIGDLVFEYRDEPGAKQVAERMKRMIAQTNPGLMDDKGKPSAEQAQAQLQALQQQAQQMQQQLQQAMEFIKTEQAKHQAAVATAQLKSQADMEIARMKNATDITLARIKAGQQAVSDQTEAEEERIAIGIKIQADREARHEEMAHDVAMASAGGQSMTVSRNSSREEGQEEAQEMSDGASNEQGSQDQPPQAGE